MGRLTGGPERSTETPVGRNQQGTRLQKRTGMVAKAVQGRVHETSKPSLQRGEEGREDKAGEEQPLP